ncbi:sensor histidine kinase [Spirosoma luteum]|uniref:sensor histidine kinase n=1 Tax=Spirosoma luteum TaxID=431553 RepID=UPI0003758328|nr:HAMP domain-containing sensor histidine kinase [Spirosoma luteum]
METSGANPLQPLAELVTYLITRREVILNHWRTACEQDPTLGKVSAMSREEFNNLLPVILDILEQRLLSQAPQIDAGSTATAHGLHRWQKAHSLRETMQELNHLAKTLYNEVQAFQALSPQTDAQLLLWVHGQIAELMSQTLNGSVQKYDELQRLEAASRAATLQQAVDQMDELARQRGDMLRTSSHDLRGSFGIINSAAYLLKTENLDQSERTQFMEMLNRNLASVHTLLDGLMDLSRLEAGEETLQVESFDAAQLLQEMVANAQPIATERNLVLGADGPASLMVETDRLKLYRIVQNLLLNALRYTPSGYIAVSWSIEGDYRWMFSIQNSGPGLPDNLTGLFARQLKPPSESSAANPDQTEPGPALPPANQAIPAGPELAQQAKQGVGGEGVGLQIVKRLCEMLDASLHVETKAGRGTLFRIRMPIHATKIA